MGDRLQWQFMHITGTMFFAIPLLSLIVDNGDARCHQDHAADQPRRDALPQQDVTEDDADNRCGEMKHADMAGHIALVEFGGDSFIQLQIFDQFFEIELLQGLGKR